MKSVLWLALGIIVGVLATYFILKSYPSKLYLQSALSQYENQSVGEEHNEQRLAKEAKTSPISLEAANRLITNYQDKALAYQLNLIKSESGPPIKSWVIDLDTIMNYYTLDDFDGLRVYPCQHEDGNSIYHSLVVVPSKRINDSDWFNIVKGDMVFQYVLPCPDNCNTGPITLGR